MRLYRVCVTSGCAALAAVAIAAPAALAEEAEPAGIVVLREVGPRNALSPANGPALTVSTAPDPRVFGVISGNLRAISDADAAAVHAGRGGAGVPAVITPILQQAFGPSGGGAAVRDSGGGGGGIGATVGGAVDTGIGAMQGALSGLGGVCC